MRAISEGRLAPGARLPSERALCDQFGVSRTVMREAVMILAAKGLIDVRSGSGLRVAPVNGDAVTESLSLYLRGQTLDYARVHEIRAVLEVPMAAAAAARRTDADVDLLIASMRARRGGHRRPRRRRDARRRVSSGHRAATHNDLYVVLLDAVGAALLEVRRANLGFRAPTGRRSSTIAGSSMRSWAATRRPPPRPCGCTSRTSTGSGTSVRRSPARSTASPKPDEHAPGSPDIVAANASFTSSSRTSARRAG